MRLFQSHNGLTALMVLAVIVVFALGPVGLVIAGPEDAPDPTPSTPPDLTCPDCSEETSLHGSLPLLQLYMDIGDLILF